MAVFVSRLASQFKLASPLLVACVVVQLLRCQTCSQ